MAGAHSSILNARAMSLMRSRIRTGPSNKTEGVDSVPALSSAQGYSLRCLDLSSEEPSGTLPPPPAPS